MKEGVLKEILEMQKKEGFDMVLTEFDEEKYEAMIRAEGITIGIEEGIIKNLCNLVSKKVITIKQALDECGLSKVEFMEKMKEYGLDTK